MRWSNIPKIILRPFYCQNTFSCKVTNLFSFLQIFIVICCVFHINSINKAPITSNKIKAAPKRVPLFITLLSPITILPHHPINFRLWH